MLDYGLASTFLEQIIEDLHAKSPKDAVYSQLKGDFPAKAIAWVKQVRWEGPVEVPISEISYTNVKEWGAYKHPAKVKKFVQKIKGGMRKPIILAKVPGETKMIVLDGHHRSLAYKELGKSALAFVAHVSGREGPWLEMHNSQKVAPSPM